MLPSMSQQFCSIDIHIYICVYILYIFTYKCVYIYKHIYKHIHISYQVLPAMSPRFYSVASSPLVLPSRVRIAFSVVSWTTPQGRTREGLCTNWLHRQCQQWTGETRLHICDTTLHMCMYAVWHASFICVG